MLLALGAAASICFATLFFFICRRLERFSKRRSGEVTPKRTASTRSGRDLSSRSKRYARVESVLEESADDDEYPDEPEAEAAPETNVMAWETRRDQKKKSKVDSRDSGDARSLKSPS